MVRESDRRLMTADREALGFQLACDLVQRGFVGVTASNRFVYSALSCGGRCAEVGPLFPVHCCWAATYEKPFAGCSDRRFYPQRITLMAITPAEAQRIVGLYDPLHKEFDTTERLTKNPPLLAHYTSVAVAEQIIKNEEIWFSHPFYMNDLEELRLGMRLGVQHFPTYTQTAVDTPARRDLLLANFNHYIDHMNDETLVDTYVLCLSEHDPADTHGVLSMWRSYASQGHGVALIFNAASIPNPPQAPLWIGKVKYCRPAHRLKFLQDSLQSGRRSPERKAFPTTNFISRPMARSIS